jgi:hypothetical protein
LAEDKIAGTSHKGRQGTRQTVYLIARTHASGGPRFRNFAAALRIEHLCPRRSMLDVFRRCDSKHRTSTARHRTSKAEKNQRVKGIEPSYRNTPFGGNVSPLIRGITECPCTLLDVMT